MPQLFRVGGIRNYNHVHNHLLNLRLPFRRFTWIVDPAALLLYREGMSNPRCPT